MSFKAKRIFWIGKKGRIVFLKCLLYFYRRPTQITMTATQEQVLPEKISWETFQEEYLSREDNFKYEWVNGQVEKTERSMNRSWLFIQVNLMNFLAQLKAQNLAVDGILISGGDVFYARVSGKQMSVCTGEDLCSAEPVIPGFVISVNKIFR